MGIAIVTLLDLEIDTIISYNEMNPSEYFYELTLHTTELDIPINLVETVEILRDYGTNIGDNIMVTFRMGMGDYIKDIYANRNNLEMTITLHLGSEIYSERYKFVTTNNNSNVYGTRLTSQSRDELNSLEQVVIEGQCVNRLVEVLRSVHVDGVFSNIDLLTVIRTRLHQSIHETAVGGQVPDINIDIHTLDNTRVYNHVQIKTGTKILDLPTYLHEQDYGLYNGNVGTYLQTYGIGPKRKETIFVYPLYNTSRFDTEDRKVIFYSSPSHKYEFVENTYLVDGTIIKIIANASVKMHDASENEHINTGNAIVNSDVDIVMERNVKVKDTVSSTQLSNNLFGEKFNDKKDKVNLDNYIRHDDNIYRHRSEIIMSAMSLIQVTWNFCNPEYLFPGIPCQYTYESSDVGTVNLKGTVHSIFFRYDAMVKSTSAIVNIWVEKPSIVEDRMRNA